MCIDFVLKIFELIYYISFIVLTVLIVVFTIKTYYLQSKRNYKLLCKFTVSDLKIGNEFLFSIEIFNVGNAAARKVKVTINDIPITTIDFIKPGSAELYPVGIVLCMMNGNVITSKHESIRNIKNGEPVSVELVIGENERIKYSIGTDILFATPPFRDELHELDYQLKNIDRACRDIAKALEKKK